MARSKFSSRVKKFILEKMSEGINPTKCCKLYPKECNNIHPSTPYKHAQRNKEWAKELEQAFEYYYMQRIAELDELSDPDWVLKRLESIFNGDSKLAFESRRAKMDAIKFELSNLAPKMAKKFDKAQKVEVEGQALGPQIVIMDYSVGTAQKTVEKAVNNLIEESDGK